MIWPEPENKRIPEGHYQFRLNHEPELKAFKYTNKDGEEKEGRKILLYVVGANSDGTFPHREEIPAWDQRYADLCAALGVEHGRDIQMQGGLFEADIKFEADRKDPMKSWPRICNIVVKDKDAGDIPFDLGRGNRPESN